MRKIGFAIVVVPIVLVSMLLALHSGWQRSYAPQFPFDPITWASESASDGSLSARQKMIKDLVSNVLPGKTRAEVERLLGESPTHEQMRRHEPADMLVRQRDKSGECLPYPKSGKGYYYDELDWDLLYYVGLKQDGLNGSPKRETLIIRFNDKGQFASWCIDGSEQWPKTVGNVGSNSYSKKRR